MKGSVVAYLRISRDKEGQELGVERQREDCQRLADQLGYADVEFIVENDVGASTRSRKKRPLFEDMMRRVENGDVSVILAYSNSRLTRRPVEFERLITAHEKHKVKIRTVVSGETDLSTADGRAVARTIATWDAAEAERIAERVSRASRQRAERGEYHGGPCPPLGYVRTKHPVTGKTVLEVDPARAALVREAADRLLSGDTLYAICNDWNHRGLTTNRGAFWRSISLRTALLSPAMVGKTTAGTLAWTPVLDEDTWERVGHLLRDPSRKFQPADGRYAGKRSMSGGVAVCDVCEKPLISQGHNGKVRMICHKQATGGCGTVTIDHDALEAFVTERVFVALESDETRALLAEPVGDGEQASLNDRLRTLSEEGRRAYQAFIKGYVTEREFKSERDRIDKEQETVAKRLTDAVKAGVVGSLDDIRATWDERSPLARRSIIQSVVRQVRVGPNPRGVATRLTPFKTESQDDYAERSRQHNEARMRQRVNIVWKV